MGEKIKVILFDMDGVLIEAKNWHYQALNKALGLFGQEISRYDHLVTYDGLPTLKKLEMLTLERGLPKKLHAFISEMKQIYTLELIHQLCKPVFYNTYALSKLKAEGYKIAVCSNSIRATIDIMMRKSGLMPFLDFFISNEDVLNPKPDPAMYIKAMEIFNFNPEQCLILEDNEHGIEAAIKSGAHLLKIVETDEVNYLNIISKIKEIETC